MRHNNRFKAIRFFNGNTLLGALLAILIFTGALLAMIQFQASLLRDHGTINQETQALTLANDKMQYFREYTTLIATPGQFAYANIVSDSNNIVIAGVNYSIVCTVTDLTNPVRKNIKIQTSWTDTANTVHTVTIVSEIASIDPNLTGKISRSL
ncbi:MAG: hypothetical protein ACD_46C00109G0003 [uncultured bacterium]|nr:MAG: hypothetical protein ACD_46C00109G0003 [uncultured bacterium]